jgi:CheY-like chemotaxis protein/HPt (histidine-containing phosphotransfer) domain-containing protein
LASYLILLVDDDDLSREIIGLTLSAEGHRVMPVSSGTAALQLIEGFVSAPGRGHTKDSQEDRIPQVVLTDMQMPQMTGRELCRGIRERWRSAPEDLSRPLLIGMSATEMPEEQLQEFDAFVTKPLEVPALQTILAERLGPGRSQAEAADPAGTEAPLDFTVVDKLRKLMPPAALDELFSTYLSDTRNRLKQLEAYAAAGDQAEVRRCAHMMKGSAAMTGASGIRRVAARLETTTIPAEEQRALFEELRCACDAIEGTLARDARTKEAHDHQTT